MRPYQPLRLWAGELGVEPLRCFNATSAASSFALSTYCPSYQNRAEIFCPLTVTVLDQAVRPPARQLVNWLSENAEMAKENADLFYLTLSDKQGRPSVALDISLSSSVFGKRIKGWPDRPSSFCIQLAEF